MHSPLRSGRVVPNEGWFDNEYLGIDQGPILLMIENYRGGFVWRVMRRNPYIRRGLERAGFSARKHNVWFQMELALPLLLMAMVLVGAGFTMRHARSGQTGTMVLLAIVSGFAIFLLRNFAQVLGENGQIPVIAAAWSPPVAALLLALSLVLHLEDG